VPKIIGLPIDYDTNWKEIITDLFDEFVLFFLPNLHADIDWQVPPQFLEQELLDILKSNYKQNHYTDKLVKVVLKNGVTKYLLVHIEIQNSHETDFAKRMFSYYALLFTKYETPEITALAIFTGSSITKKYDNYHSNYYGTTLNYRYNTYIIKDQVEADLIQSDNPFAMAILANYYLLQDQKDGEKRLSFKKKIYEIAIAKKFSPQKVAKILIFIKYLIRLPNHLENEFNTFTKTQNNPKMRVTKEIIDWAEMLYAAHTGLKTPAEQIKETESRVRLETESRVRLETELQTQQRSILNLYLNLHLSVEQIADGLKIERALVEKTIELYKKNDQ
jgi:hypothetical protein